MKNHGRYHHLRVDWVGESSTQSITLCGVEGEDIGTGQALCPDCAQVDEALNVCGLGPEVGTGERCVSYLTHSGCSAHLR